MGFSIGSAITGAISGAASGFLMGGPYGALAGGALGGAAGGFGVGGGPTSVGGITGPAGGSQAGTQAREYYDEAFPGTNPWERLGAGNPIGALGASAISAKTAERNVDVQTRSQAGVAVTQAASHLAAAKIQGRASAVQTATNYPAGNAKALGDYVADGKGTGAPIVTAPGAKQRLATSAGVSAEAATSQASSARARLLIDAERVQMEKGKAFRSPEIAALAQRAVQTFDYGAKSTPEWEAHLAKGWWKVYISAGVAAHTIREGADAVGKVLGARVRDVGARGTIPSRTSVRTR